LIATDTGRRTSIFLSAPSAEWSRNALQGSLRFLRLRMARWDDVAR